MKTASQGEAGEAGDDVFGARRRGEKGGVGGDGVVVGGGGGRKREEEELVGEGEEGGKTVPFPGRTTTAGKEKKIALLWLLAPNSPNPHAFALDASQGLWREEWA